MQLHDCDVTVDLARSSISYHNSVREPWRITLIDTGADTQTGGRLKRAAAWLAPDEPLCSTYGDGLADLDIAAQIASTARTDGWRRSPPSRRRDATGRWISARTMRSPGSPKSRPATAA